MPKDHRIKYGLKLWSIDKKDLFKEAVGLFKRKEIDFVELYMVPDSLLVKILDCLKYMPTTIHAPHTKHNFDVFWLDKPRIKFFKEQIIKTADLLSSKFIVLHADVGDSQELFKKNIRKINDKRILIENMPKMGLDKKTCFSHSYEQLKFIKNCGLDICFDFGHAIKSAIAQGLDYKEFINKLIFELNPFYFHITNGKTDSLFEEHSDIFNGEFDIKWIKDKLLGLAEERDIYLVFETPKAGKGLKNDIKNMNYFRSI